MRIAPKKSSDPCFATSLENTLVAYRPNGQLGYWKVNYLFMLYISNAHMQKKIISFIAFEQKSGYCLGSANGLVGLFSSETTCLSKGPDFHIAYYTDVYKHKDWIAMNTSYLPKPTIFFILTASLSYFLRSLFLTDSI